MRARTFNLFFSILTGLTVPTVLITSTNCFAATVTQVKGTKLLMTTEGLNLSPGSEAYVLDSSNKKIALVVIKQIKGSKALAEIVKGRAVEGGQVVAKSATARARTSTPSPSASASASSANSRAGREKSFSKKGRNVGGILAGLGMNSLSLTVQNATTLQKEDVVLKDMSFSLKGFYDYDFMPEMTIRAAVGLETFTAKGSTTASICDGGTTCSVAFNYLALEGSAHYNYLTGKTKAWVGLGYSFLVQVSKANTIPNLAADSSTNQEILISTGADFWLNSASFIPVVVEYGMFPGSSNVAANAIYIRSGYGMTF